MKRSLSRRLADICYFAARTIAPVAYAQDGLVTVHNHDFMHDPGFHRAYERGLKAIGGRSDYRWHWRVHVGLWAAAAASKLPGDFVECGVNRGFMSSAIMEYLDWDTLGKTFYLLDTFGGLDESLVSSGAIDADALADNRSKLASGFYVDDIAAVTANFAQWQNIRIVQGAIPGTLHQVASREVAYLHIDLNCAPPEIAAAAHFWDRLAPGALVLLDDYAYFGFGAQKAAMDVFAAERDVRICSLPTGQGLLVKPPSAHAA